MSEVVARIPATELVDGAMRKLPHPPFHVLLAKVGGMYFAIEDACPHSGASLCEGSLEGERVVCADHDWVIDLRTGEVIEPPMTGERNPTFEVRREGEEIVVYRSVSGAAS